VILVPGSALAAPSSTLRFSPGTGSEASHGHWPGVSGVGEAAALSSVIVPATTGAVTEPRSVLSGAGSQDGRVPLATTFRPTATGALTVGSVVANVDRTRAAPVNPRVSSGSEPPLPQLPLKPGRFGNAWRKVQPPAEVLSGMRTET